MSTTTSQDTRRTLQTLSHQLNGTIPTVPTLPCRPGLLSFPRSTTSGQAENAAPSAPAALPTPIAAAPIHGNIAPTDFNNVTQGPEKQPGAAPMSTNTAGTDKRPGRQRGAHNYNMDDLQGFKVKLSFSNFQRTAQVV